MAHRTDLAIEFEKIEKHAQEVFSVGEIEVIFHDLPENNDYGKPKGKYATVKMGKIDFLTDFTDVENALILTLQKMLDVTDDFLIVGLGNNEIISDCVGPFTSQKIVATRHIKGDFAEKIGLKNLKSVAVVTPNVLGKTGIEASDTVKALVQKIKPKAVIVVDALCANNIDNLFSVIQLSNSGISPGSGVQNARKELSPITLGVPTVAIGVPTVIEAKTLTEKYCNTQLSGSENMLLTPKETDLLSHKVSEILSKSLNQFLQPQIDKDIILSLV